MTVSFWRCATCGLIFDEEAETCLVCKKGPLEEFEECWLDPPEGMDESEPEWRGG